MSTRADFNWGDNAYPGGGSTNNRAKREKTRKKDEEDIYHEGSGEYLSRADWVTGEHDTLALPDPTDDLGMGDILYGLSPDPEADPVEEIRELRDRI